MSEKRLLVIDDEPEIGEFVRKVATGLGYEVRVTTDAVSYTHLDVYKRQA